MSKRVEDLYRQALSLSAEERERLALLLRSTRPNDFASLEIEQAWRDEIRRGRQLDSEGKMDWFPADEALQELRQKYEE